MSSPALPLSTKRVDFYVYGIPKPKGSARAFVLQKSGEKPRAIVTSANKGLKSWETSVREAVQKVAGEVFFDDAVSLCIHFYFTRPKSVSAKKRPNMTTKPDLSKLVRGTEDALTGIVFKDDSQVVQIDTTKKYVDGPSGARVIVTEF